MEQEPLILSPTAARRLKLLLGHGAVELSSKLREALPMVQNGCSQVEDNAVAGHLLWADILPFPVDSLKIPENNPGTAVCGTGGRDFLSELVLSEATLNRHELAPGQLLEVSNPDRPEVLVHLARVWPCDTIPDNTAGLAPTLAHNLGLALHLPLLLEDYDGIVGEGVPPPCRRVTIFKHVQEAASQNESGSEASLSHHLEFSSLPIASEVLISVIREPTRAVLDSFKSSPPGIRGSRRQEERFQSDTAPPRGEEDTEIVEAIQLHFLRAMRIVCQGDVLATRLPGVPATAQVLGNMTLPVRSSAPHPSNNPCEKTTLEEEEEGVPRLLFFKVVQMVPSRATAQLVDVSCSVVKLVGTCSGGIPAGLRGYLCPSSPPDDVLGWHFGAAGLKDRCRLQHTGTLLPIWWDIAGLLAPLLHPLSAGTVPNLRSAVLLHGPRGSGKRTAVTATAAALGCHAVWINCRDINIEGVPQTKIAEGLRVAFDMASRYHPALLVLEQFEDLAKGGGPHEAAAASRLGTVLADCISSGLCQNYSNMTTHANKDRLFPEPVILIACAESIDDVAAPLRRCFTHEILVPSPGRGERETLMRSFLGQAGSTLAAENWEDLVRHTAGLLPRDLRSLAAGACAAAALSVLTPAQILATTAAAGEEVGEAQLESLEQDMVIQAPPLDPDLHISVALTSTRERLATDIGAPKIPNVKWEDVGGLEDVKTAILDTVELPLKHPELFSGGLRRRSGVLLYGPPGTGKTLIAKAVATECAVNFLSVKGPELINMYVGESERLVRDVFARARRARPCVVFFDELDSLAPARGRGSDSGGVMDRVVSQLLAEIDVAQGGSGTDDVFIVGATNRPDLLDPALLRPGRLDKLLYVGVAGDNSTQLKVITALTRKFNLAKDVDLSAVAEACPPRLTGADLYALCSDAWMIALKRIVASEREDRNERGGKEVNIAAGVSIVVKQIDFEAALLELRPSLRAEDIVQYEHIRDQYQGVSK